MKRYKFMIGYLKEEINFIGYSKLLNYLKEIVFNKRKFSSLFKCEYDYFYYEFKKKGVFIKS